MKLLAAIFQFHVEKFCFNNKAKGKLPGIRVGCGGRVVRERHTHTHPPAN